MANKQHIEWLKEGVEAWNARREREDFVPDFSGADLPKAKLSKVNLLYADLRGSNCTESCFYGANLRQASFGGAKLQRADLREADLTSAILSMAKLRKADFDGAILKNACFVGCDAREASFRGVHLTDTSFNPLQIENADFTGAKFEETDLGESQIWQAKGLFESSCDEVVSSSELNLCTDQKINSLNDLLGVLSGLNILNSRKLYLRGEPALEFDGSKSELTPKVLRNNADAKNEAKFQVEFFTRQPEAAKSANVALSELVVAQHYGLKTRLLDITRNPLVALYFCCSDEKYKEQPGRIHVFLVSEKAIKPFNSDTISVLANFSRLTNSEQDAVLTKRNPNAQYKTSLMRLYHFIGMEKPHFQKRIRIGDLFNVFVVEPKREFERIKAQSGAFLISAFHNRLEASEIRKSVPQAPIYQHVTLTVPASAKEYILRELELLNITQETLFPGMATAAHAANSAP